MEEVANAGDTIEMTARGQGLGIHGPDAGLSATVVFTVQIENRGGGLEPRQFTNARAGRVAVRAECCPAENGTLQSVKNMRQILARVVAW